MSPPPPPPEQRVSTAVDRYGYAPPGGHRVVALICTGAIYAIALAGLLISFNRVVPNKASAALALFDVKPLASPPETPPKEKEAPKPVEKKENQPEVRPVEPIRTPIAPIAMPLPIAIARPIEPRHVEPETTAPMTAPAPPAPQVSSNAPDSWEGRVLAQLNKHRRYPGIARARHQQGVPYIRFVMDREGKVLSVRLERSSGFPDLDREAVALPNRAQPFAKPPADKAGETLELVVPVEFFLRR